MHVFVAGGAGFIGSNYVRHLLEETDHEVTTLDALTYAGSTANLEGVLDHPRHHFVEGNIRDESLVDDLTGRTDATVNFAAESHVDRSIQGAKPFVETNVQGTQVLLDAALKHDHERFVQISTDEVYGQTLEGTFTEDDPLNPRNPYAATKASADLLARSYYTTYDLPVVITRSSNNFGPRQHTEKLIPKFVTRAANGESLPLYGDGKHVREWLYVEDNCRAIQTVLDSGDPGEVYNIGSGIELANIEVAQRIVDSVGASEDLIEFVNDRPGHDRRYALDTSKIADLGWETSTPFDEGIRRTVDY
jgi:dTDP-glucose 4,6-dehydratase